MSRERYRARSKKVQKLGRDGLVEQDRATGAEQRVSQRAADVSFGRERQSEHDALQQGKKRDRKARLRAQIKAYQPVPAETPDGERFPDKMEALAPAHAATGHAADDLPLYRVAPDEGKPAAARCKRHEKTTARECDAPQRRSFEQPESGALRFETEHGIGHEGGQPKEKPRGAGAEQPRKSEKPLNRASPYTSKPHETTQRIESPQKRLPSEMMQKRRTTPTPDYQKAAKQRQAARLIPETTVLTHRRLHFEEDTATRAPQFKRSGGSAVQAVSSAARIADRSNPQEAEDGNVSVEAAHDGEIAAEHGVGSALRWRRNRRRRASPARPMRQTTRQAARRDSRRFQSNPFSHWQQKRAIKRQYAAAIRTGTQPAATANQTVARAAETIRRKTADFVRRHKKGFVMIGAIVFVIAMCSSLLASCSTLVQGGASAVTAATYPSEAADMLAAEAWYCEKEAELQGYLDAYEDTHAYHEYHYELDEIEHDPYVLISALTALRGGAWTMDEVRDTLQTLFDRQYILTETVTSEMRTRTVNGTEQEYTYYKCTVTLKNENLSHLPVYIMSEEQLSMYATYMGTLGNRPELFPTSGYINKYLVQGYTDYEIPASALEDETFAAMIAEAEKYLGYPYVWGGSNPNTSFDCSGFVSWVINHSGWNVGRLGAQSLYNICAPTNSPRPGDLIFFTGTFNAGTPVTHVGLYVGNGWMIHAGDPISYASVNSNYFRAHFYAYGRLP